MTKLKKLIIVVCCILGLAVNVNAQKGAVLEVSEMPSSGAFPVVSSENIAAHIVVASEERDVVKIAAEAFSSDVSMLTRQKPVVSEQFVADRPNIVIGTLGVSAILDEMENEGLITTADVKDKWETFCLKVISYKGQPCLVIFGSDPRGTAYGVFELSRTMGVNPWVWWADIVPEEKEAVYVSTSGSVYGPPSVKYRGIFINDEDWGLQPWAAKHMDTDIKDIGPKTYEKVFELMLRMKANYLWPAMHPCTKAFWYYKGNPEVAKRYDIVMGSSHCEPLLRNNVDEWIHNYEGGKTSAEWNWKTNRNTIINYWTERVVESKEHDAIYTVGMRGVHDSSMPGYSTNSEKQAALKDVIKTQRQIMSENLGKDAADVPQMFNPYKEALTLYRMGLDLADDITLVWPDDNFGYIRQLSNPEEQLRSGGGGVYYHFSYWGVPNDHLWVCSVSPTLTSYEMCKAYDQNCKNIWIYNVGDIKPAELETQFGLDLAWDIEKWRPEVAHEYLYHWALEIFGDEALAKRIAAIKKEYYRLAASGKPEQIKSVNYTEQEILQRVADYKKLSEEAQAVELLVPERLQDAYFQLIGYPCQAVASMNEKILLARLSFTTAARGERETTLAYSQAALDAYQNIVNLTNRYNKEISNGKWDGIMDYAPRGLSHFYAPSVATEADINEYETILPINPDIYKVDIDRYTTSSGDIKVVVGLGVSDTSVTVLPLNMNTYNASTITAAPFVEYSVPVYKGYNTFKVKCLPTFPIYEGLDLRYAISIDGAAPVMKSIKMEAEAGAWWTNVQTGYSYGEHSYVADKEKEVKVRIYMADPGVVLSELQVTRPDNSPYTALLVNPGFEYSAEGVLNNGVITRGDVYGWNRKGNINGNSYGLSSDATGYQGSSICWYNSTPMPDYFELSQTIEDIPAGEYIVRCKLAVFSERATNERLFANNVVQYYGPRSAYDKNIVEDESYSFAGYAFAPTNGSAAPLQEMAVKVTVLEGEPLTVGIRSSNLKADGTKATDNSGWFKVDDFRIELVRAINSDSLLNDLDTLINQARDLRDNTIVGIHNGEYPQESRSAFEKAIEDAEMVSEQGSELTDKEISEAIQALSQAVNNYKESVIDYNSYIANRSFEYKSEGVKNDGSTVRGIPYGWKSVGKLIPDAWGNQSYGINDQALNLVGQNCCWINSGVMPQPFELYQVVSGLPAGYYELTCRMACFTDLITTQRLFANNYVTYFGTAEDYDKNLTEGEIKSFAGLLTTDNSEASKANLQEITVKFFLKEGEDLRLGIRSGNQLKDGSKATNNSGWFKVDEFTLDYLGFDGMVFDENMSEVSVDMPGTYDVLLNRAFHADEMWNTFCVPFDIDAEQAALYFNDVRKLESAEYRDGACVLSFSGKQDRMEAGVPYLVKANETYESLVFNDVNVKTVKEDERAVAVKNDEVDVTMTGNYGMIDKLEDRYFIKDNLFYLADSESNVNVKGFRATIKLNDSPNPEANTLFIKVDGGVTAVDQVLMDEFLDGKLYDIKGQIVDPAYSENKNLNKLPKGIYIVHGKKIINK